VTFIAAFKCADGIVLCTDSLESDGFTKRSVRKIRTFGTTDWQVAIAGAGGSGIIEKFCDEVSATIPQGMYDPTVIETAIEDALARFRGRYQAEDEYFQIIVGVHCARLGDRRLYRSGSGHLSPVTDHVHIGVGHSLWRFLVETLYEKGSSVADNKRLALFIMRQAIQYVDGVDDPIRLASYTFGDESWKFAGEWRGFTVDFDYSPCELSTVVRDAWKKATPPSLPDQLKKFKAVRQPGDELTFLRGVEIEKLQTVSGRNRNVGFLYGNRDRLRKRALLEQAREQGQESKNQ
jgi:20S proteasome alpha/beta subunit